MWPFRGKAAAEQRAITNIDGWPWDTGGPPPGSSINVNRALSLVPVFGAARLLADSIASLTPVLYTTRTDGVPRKQPTPSLFTQPSVHGTLFDWLHRAVVSMALQGDAVGLITQRDYYGWPTMVEWLNPEQVTVQDTAVAGPGSYVSPLWWWWGNPVKASDLVHIPWFSMPYQVRGLSPIGAFKLTASVGLGAQEYASEWFGNGGVPPGTLRNTAKTVDQTEADIISRRLVSRLRSRRPFVYGNDWVYEPIAIKPHEAQFIETSQLVATDIAVIYGIPPERIGGTVGGSSLTYASLEQRSMDFLTFSLRPWLVRLETALSRLFPRGTFVKFDTKELLRTDAKTRAEINALSLGTSPPAWREVDEVRASEDLPPMPKTSAQTPLPPTQPVVVNPKVNGSNQPRYLRERTENGQRQAVAVQ